jgi:hypothetical protein
MSVVDRIDMCLSDPQLIEATLPRSYLCEIVGEIRKLRARVAELEALVKACQETNSALREAIFTHQRKVLEPREWKDFDEELWGVAEKW